VAQRSSSGISPSVVNGGLAAMAHRAAVVKATSKPGNRRQSRSSGATFLGGVSAGDRYPGLREPCTFHGGCGQSGLGLVLYVCLVKARWAAGSDDRGARDSTLPTRQRGKTTPSLESRGVRHGGQAGVNRQAPWRGFEGNLEVRDRNHRGMGARILECGWQTLTECILALTERG
jgi:hypothetical protein